MRPYFFLLLCFCLFLFISAFPSFTFVFHSAELSILFLISFYTANANEALFFFSRHDQRPSPPHSQTLSLPTAFLFYSIFSAYLYSSSQSRFLPTSVMYPLTFFSLSLYFFMYFLFYSLLTFLFLSVDFSSFSRSLLPYSLLSHS